VEEQAIDRAHRIGQDKPVFVHKLVMAETIEGKMEEMKARKRQLAESLFDADGAPTLFS
jgi:SNF2 family DNA or RNA helicase